MQKVLKSWKIGASNLVNISVLVRLLYNVLFYLAIPFLVSRLLWRSLKQPAYRERMAERFGFYPFRLPKCIWIHAVSLGEVNACAPLVKALMQKYPQETFLLTTTTPTGANRVKQIFASDVHHVYLPYDLPSANKRFLAAMQPRIGIIMETELWPNLIRVCQMSGVPLCLTNGRLSEKSAEGYRKIASLMRQMLGSMKTLAVNSKDDALRFLSFGDFREKIHVTGNIKYDMAQKSADIEMRALQFKASHKRFIWVAASTHEGEESIILAAHQLLLAKTKPDNSPLLILVPRHPDRFDAVAKLVTQTGLQLQRKSQAELQDSCNVYLGDTMGELMWFYAIADVAFIGGSLIKRGGHNMIEPASLSKPIITGEHLFNFSEISEHFVRAHALTKVQDAQSLANCLHHFYLHPELMLQQGQLALNVVTQNRGALQKQLEIIAQVLQN